MRSLQTELNDRTLRFDGVSIVEPSAVPSFLARGVKIQDLRVARQDEEVQAFNSMVAEAEQLLAGTEEPIRISSAWKLPKEIEELDLDRFVIDAFIDRIESLSYTLDQKEKAYRRIEAELSEIRRRGMVEFTKTIIHVLKTFREQGIVWGVGRGSSCASYILFILGLHAVDCIKYEVMMEEFFHD